jgi:flavin-binding protein dodecin
MILPFRKTQLFFDLHIFSATCHTYIFLSIFLRRKIMTDSTYKIVDLVGSSNASWEDAATNAIHRASSSLRDLRIAEVTKLDIKIEDGKPAQFRTNIRVSFKYQD